MPASCACCCLGDLKWNRNACICKEFSFVPRVVMATTNCVLLLLFGSQWLEGNVIYLFDGRIPVSDIKKNAGPCNFMLHFSIFLFFFYIFIFLEGILSSPLRTLPLFHLLAFFPRNFSFATLPRKLFFSLQLTLESKMIGGKGFLYSLFLFSPSPYCSSLCIPSWAC